MTDCFSRNFSQIVTYFQGNVAGSLRTHPTLGVPARFGSRDASDEGPTDHRVQVSKLGSSLPTSGLLLQAL